MTIATSSKIEQADPALDGRLCGLKSDGGPGRFDDMSIDGETLSQVADETFRQYDCDEANDGQG
jgi:hypothetical protein